MEGPFPAFFAAHTASPSEARERHPPHGILDLFVLDDGITPREVVVGIDLEGTLALHDVAELAGSPQLAFHEMARGAPRGIRARTLWLFALEQWQALPDAPGTNDPIELHGTLFGPFGAGAGPVSRHLDFAPATASGGGPRVMAQAGHIVATRADALAGLVDGTRRAFAFASDALGAMARCVHALVPADRAAAIGAGEGLVLMYPLAGLGFEAEDLANELVIAGLYYEILAALEREHPAPDGSLLPVPDRAALIEALTAEGFEIDGDEAVRRDPTRFMGGLFGGRDRRVVPAEATIDDYAVRATRALATLVGWPSERSRALFARQVEDGRALVGRAPIAPSPVVLPAPPKPVVPPRPAPAKAAAAARASRADWMRDFDPAIAPRGAKASPTPRGGQVPAPPGPAPVVASGGPKRPAWMDDFES